MKNRTRPVRIEFRVTEQERQLIQKKMAQLGTHNMGAYLRKMAIDGYIIKVDYTEQKKLEWSFFINNRGRITFNTLCRKCVHDCKQSFRAVVVECPHYRSKRAKTAHDVSVPRGPTDKPP